MALPLIISSGVQRIFTSAGCGWCCTGVFMSYRFTCSTSGNSANYKLPPLLGLTPNFLLWIFIGGGGRGAPRNESAHSSDWTVNKKWLMELYLLWIHHSLDGGWSGNKNPIRGTVGGTRWESQQQTLWHVHARTTHTFFLHFKYPAEQLSTFTLVLRWSVVLRFGCIFSEVPPVRRAGVGPRGHRGHLIHSHTSLQPLTGCFCSTAFRSFASWRRCFSPGREAHL